jgi:hypothetical protein
MSEHESKTRQGHTAQTTGRSGPASVPSGTPGKATLTAGLSSAESAAPVQLRTDVPSSPPQERSSAEGMQSVVVRPSLAPWTPARPPDAQVSGRGSAAVGSETRTSAEGLAPEQTETEKRNYMAASTPVTRDLTPSGSSGLTTISLSDVVIRGEAYEDAGSWKIRVTTASTHIHWGISTSGYQIPNPTDGGNITEANWQDVIRELAGYQTRQASGAWHDPRASEVHELNHVTWYQGEITRTWTTIETTITTHTLGATSSMDRATAETAMNTYLTTQRRAWFNAYGLAPEPPAYAAGQAVLDGVIARIRTYASSKGWTGGGGGGGGSGGGGGGSGGGSGSGSGGGGGGSGGGSG